MNLNRPSARQTAAANQNVKEKKFWLANLEGQPVKSSFPTDFRRGQTQQGAGGKMEHVRFSLPDPLLENIKKIGGGSDQKVHVLLVAGVVELLNKYVQNKDIILGTPIYRQPVEGEFINTVVPLRLQLKGNLTMKQMIVQTAGVVKGAFQHQDYPLEVLTGQLDWAMEEDEFPLFEVAVVMENIQTCEYLKQVERHLNVIFCFKRTQYAVEMEIRYRDILYKRATMEKIGQYFIRMLSDGLSNLDAPLSSLDMLPDEERKKLLLDFNNYDRVYPKGKTIQQYIEEQVERTPDNIAVEFEGQTLTYMQLNRKANQLARRLKRKGVEAETVVGIMVEPSLDMPVALLAILKAGGAYLPIDTELPKGRVMYMLENAGAKVLVTTGSAIEHIPFTSIIGNETVEDVNIVVTPMRPHIKAFDELPAPDRSLIDLGKYKNRIGMASVPDCISIQATRGCPYECLFCHKVWSKKHVFRSAENMFEEVRHFYKNGVRNFAFIDDCFNLSKKNSSRFFELILKHKLDLQIFFPNGLRGDLLTPGYIDLMVEAGTRGINLSLETASPRLQELIKKYIDIDKFKEVMDYIAGKHPQVILEIATMHGFPTETEEEAMMTLDFIKSIQWLHFPYIHILKIFPNTEMEELALAHGVSKEDIIASKDLAFHELPHTLPFPKSFTREYQADFLNNYFMLEERLQKVMPVQMNVLSPEAMVEKYNTYLPQDIKTVEDIVEFAGVKNIEVPGPVNIKDNNKAGNHANGNPVAREEKFPVNIFDNPPLPVQTDPPDAKKILFLDLTNHFSGHSMLYNVFEQPLGQMYLLTYLKQQFGDKISGRIYKSGVDFDNFDELRLLVRAYDPDCIGIRTLTFYKEFFHETVSLLRQWGFTVPIIAGGPHATSGYDTLLRNDNVDIAVLGEGEYTMEELIGHMLDNDFRIPSPDILKTIPGLAFVPRNGGKKEVVSRKVIFMDRMGDALDREDHSNLEPAVDDTSLAYVMYTSGSTGKPKGVMVEHRQVQNCIWWMQEMFNISESTSVVQRTNLSFDPSVWEMFWPWYVGGKVRVLTDFQRKDAAYLVKLMEEPGDLNMMYCPATLVSAMTYLLNTREDKPVLTMPRLIIGAEPISMETVKNFYRFYRGKIINTYGPTECTINNTYYPLEPDDLRTIVPIGKPVANNKIYIVSRDLRLMPVRTTGEICIAGESVVRGYINDDKKTDRSFIDNPFGPGKLYKTGDIGRWLDDGNIEIMGRVDQQVKIRGHRIETGEIESALSAHSAVKSCVVLARDNKKEEDQVESCKRCGITTIYPGVRMTRDGICEVCENISRYKRFFDMYFKNLDDLKQLVLDANKDRNSKYHCLLLYAGGRGAAYALYQLVNLGLRVMTATYDNGYFGKKDLDNIKKVTDSLGLDHVFIKHKNSDKILKESMHSAHTVCRGCFHTSSSLAAEYAYHNDIPIIVGATLSRGQIIENKLQMFFHQGIDDLEQLEAEIAKVQASAPVIDKEIFDLIDIDIVKDRSAYKKVKTVDFYRYCDVDNKNLIDYINHRNPYWKTKRNYAIYSTNCPIKQIGDYGHLKGAGFHYYGSATSWEKRLGHITLENYYEDLQCNVTRSAYERFMKRVGSVTPELARLDEKYLVAYLVSDKEMDPAHLRAYLGDKLPPYMIPSYFVQMDEIPLTVNGKVDKHQLPLPEIKKSGAEYVRPEGQVQEVLAEVWHEVLAVPVDQVGVDDNFFELGGDSIKAIQIVARLQNFKLKLEISQLFLNPTIRQLTGVVEVSERRIPQEPVEGDVLLTPVQHWFFRRRFVDAHHFNQSVMFFNKDGFDAQLVGHTLHAIAAHHDALRLGYELNGGGKDVRQFNRPVDGHLVDVEVVDLRHIDDTAEIAAQIEQECNRIQGSFDLENSPSLVTSALFKTPDGDHLLVAIHHLAVDGVSWRILFEDFEIGYLQAREGLDIKFQDKTDSFQYWAGQLNQYARSDAALAELDYWKAIEEAAEEPLPRDVILAVDERKEAGREEAGMELDPEITEKLLKEVNRAFNTEINDILLAALALAVNDWAGRERVVINMEGHGREEILKDVNITRTVGWFTAMYPVLLDIAGHTGNMSAVIVNIKEMLRQIPSRGIGYGILRFLTPGEKRNGVTLGLDPEISFNYLGQFNRANGGEDTLTGSTMPTGQNNSPNGQGKFVIEINGSVTGGKLGFTFSYNRLEFTAQHMQTFADQFKDRLESIIGYCLNRDETEMTISDFDAADLDTEEMDAIYDELELD